jgi:hypothetical protein
VVAQLMAFRVVLNYIALVSYGTYIYYVTPLHVENSSSGGKCLLTYEMEGVENMFCSGVWTGVIVASACVSV